MIKKQFTLYLENKPGVLAKITRLLAAKKINIEGLSISESTEVGLVQLVPSNATTTKKLLKAAGVPFTAGDISLLPLKNKPGALAAVLTKLAKEGVNINYVYSTASDGKGCCSGYAIISAPDLKKVEKVWKSVKV